MTRKRNDIEVEDVTGTSQYDGMQVLKDAHSLPGHYIRTRESLTLVKPHFDTFNVTYDSSDNPVEVTYFAGTKAHVSTIGFIADSNGDKAGGYVLLTSGRGQLRYALYMTVDGVGNPPNLEGVANVEIPLVLNDSANVIAAAYDMAIKNIGGFSVSRSNAVVEVTTNELGITNNTLEVGTGFIVSNEAGENTEVAKVNLNYSSSGNPIWQSNELKGYRYNIYTGQFEPSTTTSSSSNKINIYDTSDPDFIYIGTAAPSSATTDAAWMIQRFDLRDDVIEALYANGSVKEELVWNDRGTYNYE